MDYYQLIYCRSSLGKAHIGNIKLDYAIGSFPTSYGRHVRTILKALCHQEGYK